MKDRNVVLLITITLLAAIAVSAFVIYERIGAEKANNRVELAADFSDIERLSVIEKVPAGALLAQFKEAGVSAVALSEDVPTDLDPNLTDGLDPNKVNLYFPGKGISSDKIKLVRSSGLRIIPRLRNVYNISGPVIRQKVKDISAFDTVIFDEEEVLGYPSYLKETAGALKANKLKYGIIEFGKQSGDTALASYMGGDLVKVHSIPPEELEKMSQEDAAKRFVRAAKERAVRILYVHLIQYPDAGKDLIGTNLSFVKGLKQELMALGFETGKASAPQKVSISRLERIFIAFGIASGTLLLVHYFIPVNLVASIVMLALFGILPVKLLALISAVVFPSYALISLFPSKREPFAVGIVSKAVSITMFIAGITALGAIFIAALLSDSVHMLGIDAFTGVKIALVLPLLIVAAYFFLRRENEETLDVRTSVSRLKDLLNVNIKVFHAVLFLLAAACGALFILRSGNFGLPVTGLEKHARELLENILFIRPRTKEFLIGYPAIILGAVYYIKGGNKWLWLWLSVGVLAPVSMVNSFCHIHTPIVVTLVRSCVGLILGIALGIAAYFLYLAWNAARPRIEALIK
jgi:MFS family permease